ncbi:MAG TPA: TolC family outer membrane protein [Pseudomonadales bacterium]
MTALTRLTTGLLLLAALPLHADTLNDIYELAVKNDPLLKESEATYRANREATAIGRAGLLPSLTANAEYNDSSIDTNSRTPIFATTPIYVDRTIDSDRTVYSATLSQALFDLPAWFDFKQGKEISKQAEAELSSAQQDLIIRTAEAYFDVLRAEDNLASSRAQELAFARQLEQAQQRYDVGLIAITDVYEAQAAHDAAVVSRLSDEGALGIAYEGLTVLTGQSHQNLWVLRADFPITPPEAGSRDEWVRFSLENNFSLKASWLAAQAAKQGALSKKSEHLPTVRGGIYYTNDDSDGDIHDHLNAFTDSFDENNEGETVFLRLEVPLYSGGAISAQRRQAYEQYNAASDRYTAVQRNTIQRARSLHLAVITDAQRVKARRQAIISAQSSLDATKAGYEVGSRNVVDVLQSERLLYQALRDYANTRYDFVLNQLRLKEQAGLLSPQDIIDLNLWLETPKAAQLSQQPSIH